MAGEYENEKQTQNYVKGLYNTTKLKQAKLFYKRVTFDVGKTK